MERARRAVDDKIVRWCDTCRTLLEELLPAYACLASFQPLSSAQREAVLALGAACMRSSFSALVLVRTGNPWDAEIVLRTVSEGTFKFVHLLGERASFPRLYEEYSSHLPNYNHIKQHAKAKAALDAIPELEAQQRLDVVSPLILTDAEIAELRNNLPPDIRAMEQRWGFTGLLLEIAKTKLPFAHRMKALLHSYSMASHIAHADVIGAHMPWDRQGLGEDANADMETAHSARIISDAYVLAYTRTWVALDFTDVGTEAAGESWMRYAALDDELKAAVNAAARKTKESKPRGKV